MQLRSVRNRNEKINSKTETSNIFITTNLKALL